MTAARYAELVDLYKYGAPSTAFGTLTDLDRLGAIEAASAEANGALRSRGALPISSWEDDLRLKVVHIATYEMMCRVGFNPGAGADQNYLIRANVAREWLKGVSRGEINPGVVFAKPSSTNAQPQVSSKPLRGW